MSNTSENFRPTFDLHKTDGNARLGTLNLAHGKVNTPIFMPVGTVGSVKAITPYNLNNLQAEIILGNTYHLYLRPGMEVIKEFGGLHNFINWQKPILTDSGGFQIFSLGKLNKITEEGALFRSHLNGEKIFLTPELSTEIQETLGSDIHMVLDECTSYPCDLKAARESMLRSMRWAKRCREKRTHAHLAQFGIVQGGVYTQLRSESIKHLVDLDMEGYSIGGLSVGETKQEMSDMLEVCCAELPQDKPRYLMGVGTPLDIIRAIYAGVDMFDCVMPTRNARNGTLFTSTGKLSIKNQSHRLSHEPIDEKCSCYTCKNFSRAYMRHLFAAKELTYYHLATIHNLTYYMDLIHSIRTAITNNSLVQLLKHHENLWEGKHV